MAEDRMHGGWTFNPKANREAEREKHTERGKVPAWSFSVLTNFEDCPYRVYLQKVERIKVADSAAADRGNQVHAVLEEYVKGERDDLYLDIPKVPKGLEYFRDELDEYRALYRNNQVEVEENWGFTREWVQTGYFDDDIWARMKLDVLVHEDEFSATMVDHKTGRKKGNEVKHGSQAIVYAVGCFARYPKLERVNTKFLYFDHNDVLEKSFNQQQIKILEPRITQRALRLTDAQFFPPKPSKMKCNFCDYSDHCEYSLAPKKATD